MSRIHVEVNTVPDHHLSPDEERDELARRVIELDVEVKGLQSELKTDKEALRESVLADITAMRRAGVSDTPVLWPNGPLGKAVQFRPSGRWSGVPMSQKAELQEALGHHYGAVVAEKVVGLTEKAAKALRKAMPKASWDALVEAGGLKVMLVPAKGSDALAARAFLVDDTDLGEAILAFQKAAKASALLVSVQ